MNNIDCFKKMLVILVFGCSILFAQVRTFYFLPPNDNRWIAGNSYLYNADSAKATLMQIATDRCGWFKMEFSSTARIPEKIMIYLGSQGKDKLDSVGKGADFTKQQWIQLRTKFGTSTARDTLYLIPDSSMRFVKSIPANWDLKEKESNRCSYKMAAFIYDTDSSVNKSFFPSGANIALRRGIVKSTLDSTKKPVYAPDTSNYANWTAATLKAAFEPNAILNGKVSNIPRCYDMPFSRVGTANGSNWEFDSDKLLTHDGKNLVGGFYPYILDPPYSRNGDGWDTPETDYSACPTCRAEYNIGCYVVMQQTSLNAMPSILYRGVTYTGLDAFSRANERLANGWDGGWGNTAPNNIYAVSAGYNEWGCGRNFIRLDTVWNNAHTAIRRIDSIYTNKLPRPGYTVRETRPGFPDTTTARGRGNMSFCFESHAEFIYEKGQEFFFRGDDDIWVFINNKLVIDLGGVHVATPGYVDLDSIGRNWDSQGRPTSRPYPNGGKDTLVEGEVYPIDIFFCERKPTQSNARVSTNMYITQQSTFYSKPTKPEQPICYSFVGGNSCTDRLNDPTKSKPKKYCGKELLQDYNLEFYLVPRGSEEKILLDPIKNAAHCTDNSDKSFTCFSDNTTNGGIKIDSAVYICSGRGQCKGYENLALKGLPGTYFSVYVRLINKVNQTEEAPPLLIDVIDIKTNPRIVWGNLNTLDDKVTKDSVLKDSYGITTKKEQTIIAGKHTPIYIAGGRWKVIKSKINGKDTSYIDTTYTTFNYDNDPASINKIERYFLDGTAGLEVYFLDGTTMKKVTTWPRTIPPSGIDTLYLWGDYDLGNEPFSINIAGVSDNEETPSLKLRVYQPKLLFKGSDYIADSSSSKRPFGSGYLGFGWPGVDSTSNPPKPPYVGNQLDVYLVAWDTLRRELCEHCTFILRTTSFTNNDSLNNVNSAIVDSDASRIANGKAKIFIRGKDAVEGFHIIEREDKESGKIDTITVYNYATWRIYGPNASTTFAVWDSLQFRPTLVPVPAESQIFDRNGDGIGDSLKIKFSKSFYDGKTLDPKLLPILLGVVWDKGDTVWFNHEKYDKAKLKDRSYVWTLHSTPGFYDTNATYWTKFIKDSVTMEIARPTTKFSNDILTYGKGSLLSYTPFMDKNECMGGDCDKNPEFRAFKYPLSISSVFDRISPIVVKADYKMEDDAPTVCADILNVGCKERLTVYLSEPVFPFADTTTSFLIKNPFSYCFGYSQGSKCLPPGTVAERSNQNWNSKGWDWELPQEKDKRDTAKVTKYMPSNRNYPGVISSLRDSIVNITYYADSKNRMPKATDWVKLRYDNDVFRDIEGNGFNGREIGMPISGANVIKTEQVKIAEVDPSIPPDDPKSTIGGTFVPDYREGTCIGEDCNYIPDWFADGVKEWAKDNLFTGTGSGTNGGKWKNKALDEHSVTELLPIPKDPAYKFTNPDTISRYFPGSVGSLFMVGTTIYDAAERIMSACLEEDRESGKTKRLCRTKDGDELTPENFAEGITMNASVYYHTNLGNYTAHRDKIVANCTDKIFQTNNSLNYGGFGNNCLGNSYNVYLAWDLKTNKNRYVGVGAYVSITKINIILEYINADGIDVAEKLYKNEEIKMFGVRRGKRGK